MKVKYIINKPKKTIRKSERFLKYKYAEDLAKELDFKDTDRYNVIVSGSFYFGDFIEAFVTYNNLQNINLDLYTLSVNKNNIDSIYNITENIKSLNIVLSDYFYAHERNALVKYIYERLNNIENLQISYCANHCKIYLLETEKGTKFVFHGSANLRSSDNIEQMTFEINPELYDFYKNEVFRNIIEEYKTIKKSIRGNKLWQKVQNQEKVAEVEVM